MNTAKAHQAYTVVQPIFIFALYSGTAYAITTYRIFDAYQIIRVAANKLILILVVGGVGYTVFYALSDFLPHLIAILPTIGAALVVEAFLRKWLDRVFQFYEQDTTVRQAAYAIAQNESRIPGLEAAYISILQGWSKSQNAIIITGEAERGDALEQEMTDEERVVKALRRVRWVTPERLIRERESSEGIVLKAFLDRHNLGAAVLSETPAMNVIVGVGTPLSRRPYTYPQVTQLLELAAIIEGAFERLLMAAKIQHAEQLATVGLLGASLAHEIRNPLVSVKAIVQLLPTRYQEPEFREKFFHLISDEVIRIDRLTEQLLDLASPRVYTARPIDLHPVLENGLKLVAPRATDKQVEIRMELQATSDRVSTDPAAVTQVLLNLCFNAIQAMEGRSAPRWISVATRNSDQGVELAVSDNGPGFTSEMRKRLFRPFQTTKSSGFGLGLTVCRDILASLRAPIILDPPVPGKGATFRVTFPCPP